MNNRVVATVGGEHRVEAVAPAWGAKPGVKATLMIRPERLRLAENGGGVPVTLVAAVFQGPVVRCLLSTADGAEVVAHVGSDGPRLTLEPGRGYSISWESEAARLLPQARTSSPIDQDLRPTLDRMQSHPHPTT
jgi:ABC-type Fe3+/spermidine/putrescine transport system ATPase subunit